MRCQQKRYTQTNPSGYAFIPWLWRHTGAHAMRHGRTSDTVAEHPIDLETSAWFVQQGGLCGKCLRELSVDLRGNVIMYLKYCAAE